MISPSTAPAHGFDDYLKQLLVQSRGGVDFGNFALLRDSKPCWMGRVPGMSQAEQISGWADGEEEAFEIYLQDSLCGKVGHATTNTAIQPHAKASSRRQVRAALLAAVNVANLESSALGVAIDADVPQGSPVYKPQAYPSIPRPSGPFPWASDEELEALYAEQAGEYPYA